VYQVKGYLDESFKLRTTNPKQAKLILQNGLQLIDSASNLSEAERKTLRAQLQVRMDQLDGTIRSQEAEAVLAAKRDEERAIREQREKAKLKTDAPYKGTVGQANDFIKTGKSALDSETALRFKREAGVLAINRDILESNSVMTEERITPRFIASAKRSESKLTQAEKDLLKSLNSVMTVDFNKNTHSLKDAIGVISERTNMPIFIDEQSVNMALGEGNDYDNAKVGLKIKTSVRTILKKILADHGLTFIIKNAAVQVMSIEKSKDPKLMVTRAYPVQDLIQPAVGSPNPYMNRVQMYQAVQGLMANIMATVEPGSWLGQSPDGRATITFHEPSMSLIILHHAEFHYQRAGLLGQ
jgi:hypothetical protein